MTIVRMLAGVCVVGLGCVVMQAQTTGVQPTAAQMNAAKSPVKSDRTAAPQTRTSAPVTPAAVPEESARVKSHSNQSNNRAAQPQPATPNAGTTADKPKAPVPTKHVANIKWNARTAAPTPGTGNPVQPAPGPAAPKTTADIKPATKPQ
jgi:hypothetical protein